VLGFCRYGYKISNDVRECAFLEQLSENLILKYTPYNLQVTCIINHI